MMTAAEITARYGVRVLAPRNPDPCLAQNRAMSAAMLRTVKGQTWASCFLADVGRAADVASSPSWR
jgi:hypothetical protein